MSERRRKGKAEAERPENGTPTAAVPLPFGNPMQAWTDLMERQARLAREIQSNVLGFAQGGATFKARIQKGGRLSIPDTERDALGLVEGDLVQVYVVPLVRKSKEE